MVLVIMAGIFLSLSRDLKTSQTSDGENDTILKQNEEHELVDCGYDD